MLLNLIISRNVPRDPGTGGTLLLLLKCKPLEAFLENLSENRKATPGDSSLHCIVQLPGASVAPGWPQYCHPITEKLGDICSGLIGPIDG